MTTASANLPVRVTGKVRAVNALRSLAQPSRLMLGVAGAAAVANAMALAAPDPAAGNGSSGRLGASLQDALGKRDRDAAAERRKLEMREQAVRAGETRLAGQLQGQQQQQQADQGAPAQGRPGQPGADQPEVPYDTLAQIYQRMKPQRAAPIFEKLDLEVQAQVARRMRDSVTAQIMSYMTPSAAVELSMSLAGRKVVRMPSRTPSAPSRSGAGAPQTASAAK